jgi:hypothetical protein
VTAGRSEHGHPALPWGDLTLEVDETRAFDLGTLRLLVRRTPGEVWVQLQRAPQLGDPERGQWMRWSSGRDATLSLRPAMPDRALVVSHEYSYHLAPRGEARVFVRIPLFVQLVMTVRGRNEILADAPSIVLSDTWWGTLEEGELSYWLTTTARSEMAPELFLPHLGVCPLRLVNQSNHALPVERFALQVAHLTLFEADARCWTDEVRVRYEDSPEGSEIRFDEEPPPEAPGAALLAPARVKAARGLHARTFDRLRSISTLGL